MAELNKKIFYRISEFRDDIERLYENGIQKGHDVGFNGLKDLYSLKKGATTYIMGSPYSGKTQIWFEFLMNLSEFKGLKHLIYSPETGSKEEIAAELCHYYMKKPFYKGEFSMTDQERYKAQAWLDEHFFIVDPGEVEITIDNFLDIFKQIEALYNIKIDTATIDPFNEIKHVFDNYNGRQDLYIESMLGAIRRMAKTTNTHFCVITHCKDQTPITENGITYYPPPTARDYAGGQAWFRKGMAMIAIWRPPSGLENKDGVKYADNETHIIIQKSKPKGIGRNGLCKLYYDWQTNRYYEIDEYGIRRFSKKDLMTPKQDLTDRTVPIQDDPF